MRTLTILILFIGLWVSSAPAAAQTDDLPLCSSDEVSATIDALIGVTDGFSELGPRAASTGANPDELPGVLVEYERFNNGFWTEVYPSIPACLEAKAVTYDMAQTVNEILIFLLTTRNFYYAAQSADMDAMTGALELLNVRAETFGEVSGQVGETFTLIGQGQLPEVALGLSACNDKAMEVLDEYYLELLTAHAKAGELTLDAAPEDVAAMFATYNHLSYNHWHGDGGLAALPTCMESYVLAHDIGFYLDQSVIAAGLLRVSSAEVERGDKNMTEIAELLVNAAEARLKPLGEAQAVYYERFEVEASAQ